MIKLSQVAQAIRDNGMVQARDTFFQDGNGQFMNKSRARQTKPEQACAMGQAAINLDVEAHDLYMALSMIFCDVANIIVQANDNDERTLAEIADLVEMEIVLHGNDPELSLTPDPEFYQWKQSENVLSGV